MHISKRNVKKIIDEVFTNPTPIIVEHEANQKEYLEVLQKKLTNIPNWKATKGSIKYYGETKTNYTIDLRSNDFLYHDNLEICFDSNNRLILVHQYQHAYLHTVAEVELYVEKMQQELNALENVEIKKDKIRDIKTNAIVASIKQIAEEINFQYSYNTDKFKVILRVKLNKKKNLIEIHIPYNKFQEVLPNVKGIIKSIFEMEELGINFKIKGYSGITWSN